MRKESPSGHEIARKARGRKLLKDKDIKGETKDKKLRFRQADLSHVTSLADLEEGQVVGVLDTEFEGDESGLPPGNYNLFLDNVNGDWEVLAEADGEVVAKARRVKVEFSTLQDGWKPEPGRFAEEGWCLVNICLVGFFGFCLVSIGFMCF